MASTQRRLERVLIVEDYVPLRAVIVGWIRSWGVQALEAGTSCEAKALLSPSPPDLILTDLSLPDEDGFAVLEAASRVWPVPIKVAMSGDASPGEAFRAAQCGARAYLSKPFSVEELTEAVDAVRHEAPHLDALITQAVGHIPMRELQDRVRDQMVKQALALSGGNRSGAARLLAVSRQAVQQMLRGSTEPPQVFRRLPGLREWSHGDQRQRITGRS